jgi:hypothetical protein
VNLAPVAMHFSALTARPEALDCVAWAAFQDTHARLKSAVDRRLATRRRTSKELMKATARVVLQVAATRASPVGTEPRSTYEIGAQGAWRCADSASRVRLKGRSGRVELIA